MFKFKQYDFKRYNVSMLIIVIILGCIGCYLIKQVQTPEENIFLKQCVGLVSGLVIAVIVSLIDYHFICKFYIILYLLNIGMLVYVKLFGITINFAKRWIDLKITRFQPSELSKIIIILFCATLFTMFKNKINNALFLITIIVLVAIPTLLILTQTDLSTSMVLMFSFTIMLFAAGLSYKIILPALILGIPGVMGLFWYIQQDYQVILSRTQRERVLSILNPELYPAVIYQQENSIKAIGSGQLLGKIFTENAASTKGYRYVPISESDFIFCVAGEELGFIGSCIVLGLYAIIIYKCIITAKKAPDQMGTLIAIGIASMFMFQVFVNVGVATAILPNTGLPLPFLSYGLSSLWSGMIAVGIILNIRLQAKTVKRDTLFF